MATEMGAIIILIPPSKEIIDFCRMRSGKDFVPLFADSDAIYEKIITIDVTRFVQMVSLPGEPHNTVTASSIAGLKIDSAFIGSCTNGRIEDMRKAGAILRNRKIAPGVVLKIVPATDRLWKTCLEEGLIEIFKKAGALVSNAGCAGCAAGQVGQNGPGEVTISTGNRNFPGKQGKGDVYLASPDVVAASAIAGFITTSDKIPSEPALFSKPRKNNSDSERSIRKKEAPALTDIIEGRVWIICRDNIDTDMIYHNRYLTVTDIKEMGQYAFENIAGYEDFAAKVKPGDIIATGKNFGSGSSRQQAVDCFISLGIKGIIAESFGAIYERNAINAAFPVITCKSLNQIDLHNGDNIRINILSGEITNLRNGFITFAGPFSEVQYEIYSKGGLLG
jgi:3-isopropylmalate/(R)-2-methylmalate dehydratase large subunit